MVDNTKNNKYIRASERVEELKKFYGHLTSYVFVIIGLGALNYWVDAWRYMWFLWAAFGWGIGIFFHALNTFKWNPFFGKDWEKRKIEELLEKDKEQEKWK